MRFRHVLYLGCSIILLVFVMAVLWEFAFGHWMFGVDSAGWHQGESIEEHWEHVATATGVALTAVIFPLWVAALAVRERERAENALGQRETWLKEAAQLAKLGHYIWDEVENKCIYCDEEYARILGVTPEEFLSNSVTSEEDLLWVHPDDRERYRTVVLDEALQHCSPLSIEYRIVRRDGEIRHILERGKPVLDKTGSVIRTIGTIHDITERKQAEEALQAAHDSLGERVEEQSAELGWEITRRRETEHALRRGEARLMAILDNAPVEIYLKDIEGRYVLINRQYERLWGVTKESVRGKLPGQVHEQEDFAAASRAHDLAVLESGEVIEQDDDVLMDDGLHTLRMIKFPIRDAAGEISGLGAIAADVTESKKLERVKDEFISSVSHELRTPMACIVGALGLIHGGAAGRLPETAQSMLEITYRNCTRLVRLINNVLDIDKMESGCSNFEMSRVQLAPLVRDAIESIAHYSSEYDVEVRLVEDSDSVEVKGDGDRLIQVLTNLLSNAIKFSPQSSFVEVRISRIDHSARVSVTDCGPGIPDDFRGQVFERFTQADRTDRRCRGGTGLGLSICKMIIDQHDGSIGFETEIGTGTTFYFDLPECAAEESSGESAAMASCLHREQRTA